jgi:RHS repeat-associated protein
MPTRHESSAGYRYGYNGKELENETDLDVYDYGARFYNPAVPFFWSIDPKADKYTFQSPYVYAQNNPVLYMDINGEGTEEWDDWYKNKETGEVVWFEGSAEKEGYEYLAWSCGSTDIDGNRTEYDPITRSKSINGIVDNYYEELDEVIITSSKPKPSLISKIVKTGFVASNMYAGYNESMIGAGLLLVPEPTLLTKAAGSYAAIDGITRTYSGFYQLYGIWSEKENYENSPDNLLSTVGYVVDQNTNNPNDRIYQTSLGLVGDFGLNKAKAVQSFNKMLKLEKNFEKLVEESRLIYYNVISEYHIYNTYMNK